jgi:L-lactate permease
MPPLLCILSPWALVKKNLVFIVLSLLTVVGPSLALSFVNEEFPALIGGMVGCIGTAVLIKYKLGLSSLEDFKIKDDGKDLMEIGSVSDYSIVKKIEATRSVASSGINNNASSVPVRKNYKHATSSMSDVTTEAFSTRDTDVGGVEQITKNEDDDNLNGIAPKRKQPSVVPEEEPMVILPEQLLEGDIMASQQEALEAVLGPRKEFGEGYVKELLCRTSPIWLVVVLLVLTRVEQIGLKEVLQKLEPNFAIFLGTYGTFRLSASLVLQLSNILSYPDLNWEFEFLYLPFFMPFCLVSFITMAFYRKDLQRSPREIAGVVIERLTEPAIAVLGALCLVQLMLKIDSASPSFILGTVLSDWFQEAFIIITPLLGALGSFFSGSTTVSNLTFGAIQSLAADAIGVSKTSMLALQAVGASAGNGICLNNIIAACAVVGLNVGEGAILKQTYKFVLGISTITTIIMLAFFLRF